MQTVSNSPTSASRPDASRRLADPELRRLVEKYVRRRVPEAEVDDIVQTVLCDALAAESLPDGEEPLRKWLVGITRHKVADFHRRGSRVRHVELPEQLEAESEAHSAREWLSWAEKQTANNPDAGRTLDWMARESAGEKLAHIAEEEQLPPAQVRQRVSRMRRWMREQWKAELAAVALVTGVAVLIAWLWSKDDMPVADPVPQPVPEAVPPPRLERARELRAEALRECERAQWRRCLDGLDEARRLDPAGDADPAVKDARQRAADALAPPPPDKQAPLDKDAKSDAKSDSSTPAPRPSALPAPRLPTKPTPKTSLESAEPNFKEPPPQPPVQQQKNAPFKGKK